MDRPGFDNPLRVRFAPSSTGPLDVGAARTALFNWLLARATGGSFVVCVDDTGDSARAGEAALLRDLRWLGLDWDEGPDTGATAPYRRSERGALYAAEVQRLLDGGSAYERDGALWFRVPPGTTVVHDLIKGDVAFDHDAIADFVVRKSRGTMTYDLIAAVDDATMRIDLVLRGDEHLDDTPRQMLIARALGYEPPRYAHAALVVGAGRHKLSSADGPVTVDALRRAGFLPEAVIEHLALLGWSAPDGRETFALPELVTLFSLDRVGHSPSVFDFDRLRAFNARALRALSRERYRDLVIDAMQRHRLLEQPVPDAALRWVDTFLEAYGDEVYTLGEALEAVAALREEAVTIPALELERLRNRQVLFFLDAVAQYVDAQPELRGLPLADDLPVIASEFGLARKDAFEAVRMALTGSHDGPPLALLFPLLGHDRIMIRIGAVNSHILHGRGLEPIKYGPGGVPFETIQATRPASVANGGPEFGATERSDVVS
ncbi:MAG: nondiscriminating glutamyl-tRNA synthetase [Candidatus Eremiobacteraeota bacterium]|nr:nondiscriminating glutamyl-tRNA synthetase [Candidatus Eremiobacteraeota bacterium]